MSVSPPPRRRLRRARGVTHVEALREQTLIEEARRRARQRRLGNLAVIALGLAVVAQSGFVPGAPRRSETPGARPALLPASADGNGKLAFADRTGSLALVNPDGSGLRTLSRCTDRVLLRTCLADEPAWSPDGMRLAFVRGNPRRTAMALYVTDQGAARPRLLAPCGTCGGYAYGGGIGWSPDSTQLVYSATGSRPAVLSLFTVDTDSGSVRRLTDCEPSSCADAQPDWSRDGQRIVFTRTAKGGSTSLYTVRPDGSGLTKVKSEPEAAHPRWSPDGRLIAYDTHTHDNIYVVDADGTQPSRLLASDGPYADPHLPSWSPDGHQIAFSEEYLHFAVTGDHFIGTPHGDGGIFVVNADGSGTKRISKKTAAALSWQRVQ